MYLIMFLLSFVSFFAATNTPGMPGFLTAILIFASLGFFIWGVLGFLSARLSNTSRDDSKMISPEELRMMREQAEARKNAQKASSNEP
jgi:threonine/homoserine/homoserine lactone efflux protein